MVGQQRIVPVYQRDPGQPPLFFSSSSRSVVVRGRPVSSTRFPDHMHEGVVIEDDDVQLNEPLGIPGFDGVEYPVVPQVVAPVTTVGLEPFGLEPFGLRPRPHVIARGWTTNEEVDPKLFGLIGVYDGDSVKLGRVVVDSTWHHWFSMNLVGFRDDAPDIYRGMQSYYRNVALWLSTPEQRAAMLFAAAWGVLVGKQPGALSKVMGIWGIGERVVDVIGRTTPRCGFRVRARRHLPWELLAGRGGTQPPTSSGRPRAAADDDGQSGDSWRHCKPTVGAGAQPHPRAGTRPEKCPR